MERRLKVMQVMPEYALAGAEIMVENLSVALVKEGFDVCNVSLYNHHSAITERLEIKNIPVFYLGKKRGIDLKIIYRLYKLFKEEKPNVIHTHRYIMPYVIPAAILAGVKTRIHTIHNIAKKEVGKLNRIINNFFYKYCNVVPVSISPLVKNSVIEEYGIKNNRIPMIYNGIELRNCIPKKEYSQNVIKILHIGRLSEQKNHLGLIESFKIVNEKAPNTILYLIGEGELEDRIKSKVKELHLEECVCVLGLKSNVYPFLNEADIFVLPSKWEGMPITLIEAMATGLPIVATNVGGIPDMIVDNVSGLLVNTNSEDIAEALIKLIFSSDLRQELGCAAKIASKQFSAKVMTEKYINLYNQE